MNSKLFRGGYNFLGLADEDCRYEESKAAIIPVPYDSTTSYRAGTREGPSAIISASRQVELYDIQLKKEPLLSGLHTLPEVEPDMRGPKMTLQNVEKVVNTVVADGLFPVILGGEHSISIAPVKALKKKFGNLSVLQIDAHADLRDEFENTPHNHACVMRRIWDVANNIAQVGIRNISAQEAKFIEENNHQAIYWAHDISDPSNISWHESVINNLGDNVYITIDLDGFDPSIMPAVGTPEPGGLQWHNSIELLNKVIEQKNVIGFDVVELCPLPGNIVSDFFAAKLVFKLLGKIFTKNSWS